MKKKLEMPTLEVVELNENDVIATSGCDPQCYDVCDSECWFFNCSSGVCPEFCSRVVCSNYMK